VREISAVKDQQMKEAAEKSARSVFVGNIPYEATDEQLKDIFNQAGPVMSFRMVYDRETGKPKGYGFCEYKDVETAQSAMRNLNGTEIHGRQLRVDSAASQKGAEDPKAYMKEISPYGEAVNPNQAPETITSAVASLPPEQMFELMKQMKLCIQNNPEEARHMLIQNPQLAYALLQAQVIMKIVDPKVADAILHQPRGEPLPINKLMEQAGIGPGSSNSSGPMRRPDGPPPPRDIGPPPRPPPDMYQAEMRGPPPPDMRGAPPPDMRGGEFGRGPPPPQDRDMRGPPPSHDRDFRGPPPPMEDRFRDGAVPPPFDPRDRPPIDRMGGDPRGGPPPPIMDHRDPRMRIDDHRGPPRDERGPPRDDRGINRGPPPPRDPRGPIPPPHDGRGPPPPHANGPPPPDMRDPRGPPPPMHGGPREANFPPSSHAGPPPAGPPPPSSQFEQRRDGPQFPAGLSSLSGAASGSSGGPNEEEKQRLIMQVLNLTDSQINMLPEDQRESIRLLKSQFSGTRP